jgi:hypothetical protein
MQSKAKTVKQYLAELPPDRRVAIEAIRKVILANLDDGFEEGMTYGMIGYYIPHRLYPPGYHVDPKQPLGYAALASQKNYMSLYLGSVYSSFDDGGGPSDFRLWFQAAWKAAGKKLDMGKSCIRFKKLDDVPLDVLAETIRRVPLAKYLADYEACLAKMEEWKVKRAGKTKPAKKKSARAQS